MTEEWIDQKCPKCGHYPLSTVLEDTQVVRGEKSEIVDELLFYKIKCDSCKVEYEEDHFDN